MRTKFFLVVGLTVLLVAAFASGGQESSPALTITVMPAEPFAGESVTLTVTVMPHPENHMVEIWFTEHLDKDPVDWVYNYDRENIGPDGEKFDFVIDPLSGSNFMQVSVVRRVGTVDTREWGSLSLKPQEAPEGGRRARLRESGPA